VGKITPGPSLLTISTGDEIVRGRSVDTNAPWIAARAAEEGVLRTLHTAVGDDPDALAEAFLHASERVDFVIVTGGLGPTEDDHTRFAAARAAGVGLVEDPEVMAEIEERFRSRGLTMLERNRVQARFPEGAIPLRNPLGTAPGFSMEIGRARLFFLSGVPREMEVMFESGVRPALRESGTEAAYLAVPTFGKPEAYVDEALEDLSRRDDLSVGITAVYGRIRVTVQTVGDGAKARAAAAEAEIRDRLGDLVLEAPTLEESVAMLLAERDRTLATAESCTGGLISGLLTDVPGISAHFLGGLVTYANEAKVDLLGVDPALLEEHGAVSEPVARAMAEGACDRLRADLAVSVTGVAGPGGGTEEKPVGLVWFAVADGDGTEAVSRRFPGDREFVRRFSANVALHLVRRRLLNP